MIKKIIFIFYTISVSFVLLEILFSFLPVSTARIIQEVNEDNPISHFKKHNLVTVNSNVNFSKVIKKKTNNYGYFSNLDYSSNKNLSRCRNIVIGDSYVEADQVLNSETFHAILNSGKCETYALGKSGDPLSQYIAYAEFAIDEFEPDNLIFLIIDNDYDESWLKYKSSPATHYFNNNEELVRVDFKPSLKGLILRKSDFLYFLHKDLKIHVQLKKMFTNNKQKIQKKDYELRIEDMKRAAEIFLEKISHIGKDRNIILIVDGDRRLIYQNKKNRNNDAIGKSHKHLLANAKKYKNIKVIDLHPLFFNDWIKNKKKFNSTNDYHWNTYGHSFVGKNLNYFLNMKY